MAPERKNGTTETVALCSVMIVSVLMLTAVEYLELVVPKFTLGVTAQLANEMGDKDGAWESILIRHWQEIEVTLKLGNLRKV